MEKLKIAVLDTSNVSCRRFSWFHDSFLRAKRCGGLYAFTFMFDPYILGYTKSIPQLISNLNECGDVDLLVSSHRMPKDISEKLVEIERNGGSILLVQPHSKVYSVLSSLSKRVIYKGEIISTAEDWVFKIPNAERYKHAFNLPLQILEVQDGEVYSRVGEFPDLIVAGKVAVFATDAFHTYDLYRKEIFKLVNDFTILFTLAIRRILGSTLSRKEISAMKKIIDLRRDFHSFGFAYQMVKDLARELGEDVDLGYVDDEVVKAARIVMDGDPAGGREALKKGFKDLAEVSWRLAPIKKYIMDSYHGGILFNDVGFSEYESPQFCYRWLLDMVKFVETKNYKFNYEVEARTIENMNRRFPSLYKKFAQLWKEGKIEIVNGTYAQPYIQLFPLESSIRQFEYGLEIIEKTFGNKVETYQAQEFAFTPQLPQILSKFGYKFVVHRTQNCGKTPIERDKILWRGVDNTVIQALPSHHDRSELHPVDFFMVLPKMIATAVREGYRYVAFTNMLDQGWHPHFREEAIRTAFYAPVLGEFVTFKEFFELTPPPCKAVTYRMDDYWTIVFNNLHGKYAKGIVGLLMKAVEAECVIQVAERLEAMLSIIAKNHEKRVNYDELWKALIGYQHHDPIIVPRATVGYFFHQYLVDYAGPFSYIECEERADQDRVWAVDQAKKAIESNLDELARRVKVNNRKATKSFVLFNPLSFERTKVVSIPFYEGGKVVDAEGKKVPAQKSGNKLIFMAKVPSFGYTTIHLLNEDEFVREPRIGGACYEDGVIENENLRIRIDKRTGALSEIYYKKWGENVLKGLGNELVYAERSEMICDKLEVLERGPVRVVIRISGRILASEGEVAQFRTTLSLASQSKTINFVTEIKPLLEISGDPWKNSIRCRFHTAFKDGKVYRCYHDVGEETGQREYTSLHYTRIVSGDGKSFDMYNRGNQHYIHEEGILENVLFSEKEERRVFEYAVGIDNPNGLTASLDWQFPVLCKEIVSGRDADLPETVSAIHIDASNVIVSGISLKKGKYRIRIVETQGKKTAIRLSFPYLRKTIGMDQTFKSTFLELKPWEIAEVAMEI